MITKVFKDLVRFEGFRDKPYLCSAKKLTIGYGRNLEDNGISRQEAEMMMFFDVCRIMDELNKQVNFWVHQPVVVKVILIQMAYQMGVGGLLSFKKFLNALSKRNYEIAIVEMLDSKWAKQTPKRAEYLVNYLKYMPIEDNTTQWKNDMRTIIEINNNLNSFSLFE